MITSPPDTGQHDTPGGETMDTMKQLFDAKLKLASELAIPASVTSPETAQAEADRWAEEKREKNAAYMRDWRKRKRVAVKAMLKKLGWNTLETMAEAGLSGDVKLPRRPKNYIVRRGRRW